MSEVSGVAASPNNANVLYAHNDSGHPSRVFAMDTQGRLLATYTLPGNTDNESIGASVQGQNWTTLGGVVLTNAQGIFIDAQSTNFTRRFYRATE